MNEKPARRRPNGWVAPGPSPRGARGLERLAPKPEEDLSYLTGDFRIFQMKRGHRWSLDDFATALFAIRAARSMSEPPRAAIDLGTGIGSVLMMVAWALPDCPMTGIEAQDVSISLARRSLEYNGVDDRTQLLHGDLRDVARDLPGASFDLVTGTPPYIPIGHGLVSDKAQRGPCCFETRGGIEDYCAAAQRLVSDRGVFVVCAGAQPEGRALRAALEAGLSPERVVDVVPREGKPVLFHVLVLSRARPARAPHSTERFVVRDVAGRLTADMRSAREELGIPEMEAAPSSS